MIFPLRAFSQLTILSMWKPLLLEPAWIHAELKKIALILLGRAFEWLEYADSQPQCRAHQTPSIPNVYSLCPQLGNQIRPKLIFHCAVNHNFQTPIRARPQWLLNQPSVRFLFLIPRPHAQSYSLAITQSLRKYKFGAFWPAKVRAVAEI